MSSRRLLKEFDRLLRNTNSSLKFDPEIMTDTVYMMLTMAQEQVISDTFLQSPNLLQNIEAVQKRSDILRNVIKRQTLTKSNYGGDLIDGGKYYNITVDDNDYWIYLKAVLQDDNFSTLSDDVGGSSNIANIRITNHNEATSIVSNIYDEPILEDVPGLLEEDKTLVIYLDKEKKAVFSSSDAKIELVYMAYPPEITEDQDPVLPEAMYKDIVKLAVDDFIMNYKYRLRGNEANK